MAFYQIEHYLLYMNDNYKNQMREDELKNNDPEYIDNMKAILASYDGHYDELYYLENTDDKI
jgi:hypothetical protein